jgi:hypothetical protein
MRIAETGISIAECARQAGLGAATLRHIINPSWNRERRGGLRLDTAWKISRKYAELMGIEKEQAWDLLFTEDNENFNPAAQQGTTNNQTCLCGA